MIRHSFPYALAALLCSALVASLSTMANAAAEPTSPIAPLEVVTPVQACAELTSLDLTDIGGVGSQVVSAEETTHDGTAVCEVAGSLAPSIGFRMVLPTGTWTQRYLQVGCGGLCGRISLDVGAAEACQPLETGQFVVASTDMGHQGMDATFGRDAQKRADFAHRAVHLTRQASKKLIQAYYGRPEAFAYFTGCSDGGREALMEAQRYPDDFDGIIAGAAALNFQVQNALYHAWQARANQDANGKAILTAARLPLLHSTVMKQCDGLDGQVDGLITDPRACSVDLQAVQCEASQDSSACLTPAEVLAARRLYEGPRDLETGEHLTAGGPQPGSELAWAGVFVPMSADQPIFSERIALQALGNLNFEQAPPSDFTLNDLHFNQETFDRLVPRHSLFDATNPDLSRFEAAGGKLILWHGWADPHISPLNTLAYHEALVAHMGEARAERFERLYLLPGVYHCSGGEGPSLMDLLTPLMGWAERGQAPDAIITTQAGAETRRGQAFGAPTGEAPDGARSRPKPPQRQALNADNKDNEGRARPLYPYPSIATYKGEGDPLRQENYERGAPLTTDTVPHWRGADWFTPAVER